MYVYASLTKIKGKSGGYLKETVGSSGEKGERVGNECVHFFVSLTVSPFISF